MLLLLQEIWKLKGYGAMLTEFWWKIIFNPSLKVTVKLLSHVQLFAATGTVAYQAPQSMGFSRKEYCWGLPFPSPGDLPQPGIETGSPAL